MIPTGSITDCHSYFFCQMRGLKNCFSGMPASGLAFSGHLLQHLSPRVPLQVQALRLSASAMLQKCLPVTTFVFFPSSDILVVHTCSSLSHNGYPRRQRGHGIPLFRRSIHIYPHPPSCTEITSTRHQEKNRALELANTGSSRLTMTRTEARCRRPDADWWPTDRTGPAAAARTLPCPRTYTPSPEETTGYACM